MNIKEDWHVVQWSSCQLLFLLVDIDIDLTVFLFFRKTFPRRIIYSVMAIVLGAMVAARYRFLILCADLYILIVLQELSLEQMKHLHFPPCPSSLLVLIWPSMWRATLSSYSMMSLLQPVVCTPRKNLTWRQPFLHTTCMLLYANFKQIFLKVLLKGTQWSSKFVRSVLRMQGA